MVEIALFKTLGKGFADETFMNLDCTLAKNTILFKYKHQTKVKSK